MLNQNNTLDREGNCRPLKCEETDSDLAILHNNWSNGLEMEFLPYGLVILIVSLIIFLYIWFKCWRCCVTRDEPSGLSQARAQSNYGSLSRASTEGSAARPTQGTTNYPQWTTASTYRSSSPQRSVNSTFHHIETSRVRSSNYASIHQLPGPSVRRATNESLRGKLMHEFTLNCNLNDKL